MIEFAPATYVKEMTYQEAAFYCWSLSIDGKRGWRLPTQLEFSEYRGTITYLNFWYVTSAVDCDEPGTIPAIWLSDDASHGDTITLYEADYGNDLFWVHPVRDL